MKKKKARASETLRAFFGERLLVLEQLPDDDQYLGDEIVAGTGGFW